MIKLIFPPGCYGTFLSKCVYELTNLSGKTSEQFTEKIFEFDSAGSSHDFRHNIESKKHIEYGHLPTMQYNNSDIIISVVPCQDHSLDYYNNQFIKEQHQQVIQYIETMFTTEEIQKKLFDNWNYANGFNCKTPRWILREWCSLWLKNCLDNGYNSDLYASLPAKIYVNTQELFLDLYEVLENISNRLNLKLYASFSQVKALQNKFVQAQRSHNIQTRCNFWVNKILGDLNSESPCVTLFDEAWVQHRLRLFGYEIQCDGLNNLPTNARDLTKLIYKNV